MLSSKTGKITGIILYSKPAFEADQWLEVFTADYGKLKLLSKFALKSKKGRTADPCMKAEFLVYKGHGALSSTNVHIFPDFFSIRDQFNRISMAFHFIDVVRKSTAFEQPNLSLYTALDTALNRLSTATTLLPIQLAFYEQFLDSEGLQNLDLTISIRSFQLAFEAYTGYSLHLPLLINSPCDMIGSS